MGQGQAPEGAEARGSELLGLLVEAALERRWSPQPDCGVATPFVPRPAGAVVSHETIYQSLYVQVRGALRKELTPWDLLFGLFDPLRLLGGDPGGLAVVDVSLLDHKRTDSTP